MRPPRLPLRSLLATPLLALLVLAASALPISAQTTEPIGAESASDTEVYRAYDNPDVYFDAMGGIFAFGTIYPAEASASRSLETTPEIFAASLRNSTGEEGGDYVFSELEDVDAPQLGDASRATRLPFVLFESFDGEYGILVVQQGAWVQVLIAFGVGEVDILGELQALAESMLPRWPSEDPITVREDGLRTGGIWNVTPLPEDLDPAFVVDTAFEEGPAATGDTPGDAPAPDVQATPVAGDDDADETEPIEETDDATATPAGDRQVPLIPTPAPDADETDPIQPIDADGTATAEADEAPEISPIDATPAPDAEDPGEATTPTGSSRLAPPFDLAMVIILGPEQFEGLDDGSCVGAGLLSGLGLDGELVLRDATGTTLGSTIVEAPGIVGYDTILLQDVCVLSVQFTEVQARSAYVLVAGNAPIGNYSYEDLSGGGPIEVVIAEEPEADE